MAITINGTGSITGLTAGGLPDGSVTAADIETSLDLTGKTVTLPSGTGGKILQVVSTTKTNATSSASAATYADISGMSVTIQPSSTNNKILIFGDLQICQDYGLNRVAIRLTGGNTSSYLSTISHGTAVAAAVGISTRVNDSYGMWPIPFSYLDSPNTTSSITYQVQWRQPNGNGTTHVVYLNYSNSGSDAYSYVATSTITAVEVAG